MHYRILKRVKARLADASKWHKVGQAEIARKACLWGERTRYAYCVDVESMTPSNSTLLRVENQQVNLPQDRSMSSVLDGYLRHKDKRTKRTPLCISEEDQKIINGGTQ